VVRETGIANLCSMGSIKGNVFAIEGEYNYGMA